jgi:hypothetical protein
VCQQAFGVGRTVTHLDIVSSVAARRAGSRETLADLAVPGCRNFTLQAFTMSAPGDIRTGPGRFSGAASLVASAGLISTPVALHTFIEQFLNLVEAIGRTRTWVASVKVWAGRQALRRLQDPRCLDPALSRLMRLGQPATHAG